MQALFLPQTDYTTYVSQARESFDWKYAGVTFLGKFKDQVFVLAAI